MLKRAFSLFLVFLIVSCQSANETKSTSDSANVITYDTVTEELPQCLPETNTAPQDYPAIEVTFEGYQKEGFLLNNNCITIFDDSLRPVDRLCLDSITPVAIIEKSTKYLPFPGETEDCSKAYYVKVKYGDAEYILFGRDVYETLTDFSSVFEFHKASFELLLVKHFEKGAADDSGLTGCDDYRLLLLHRTSDHLYTLIENPQEYDSGKQLNTPFAALISDDGMSESISDIQVKGNSIILKVAVGYQEGGANYDFIISYNPELSKGRIENFVRM